MFDESFWGYAIGNKIVEFGPKEGKLLLLLIENKKRIVTYNEISKNIYGYKCDKSARISINSLIKRIKTKTKNTINIKLKRNIGYMLD